MRYILPIVIIFLGIGTGLLAVTSYLKPPEVAPSTPVSPKTGSTDCGAASLYVICKRNGKECSLPYVRVLTGTTALGTNMNNLKIAAEAMGFDVEAVSVSFQALTRELSKPKASAILFLEPGHFVSAFGGESGFVRVLDPTYGVRDCDQDGLQNDLRWKGEALFIFDKGPVQ